MKEKPLLALRWHVARYHPPDPSPSDLPREAQEAILEVVIARSSEAFPPRLLAAGVSLMKSVDRLEWWNADEDSLLHGWTTNETLLTVLRESPTGEPASPGGVLLVERRIVEDMVFLQFGSDPSAVEDLWQRAAASESLPDVSDLALLKGAVWMDYTKPARRMAKAIYTEALQEATESEEEFYEAQ